MSELLEKLQAEMNALRAQVTRQEVEISQLKSASTPATSKKTTSRRKMLTQLGVAAAGVATLGALNPPPSAEAAPGSFNSTDVAVDALTVTHTAGGTSIKATSSGAFGPTNVGINAVGGYTGVAARASGTGSGQPIFGVDAIANGAFGVAVRGTNSSTTGLVHGVKGEITSNQGTAVYGTNTNTDITSVDANGVKGEIATGGGFGVLGFCNGTNGYGLGAQGGKAQFYIAPDINNANPPTTSNHNPGEFFVTSDGSLYYCLASGLPPTWQKIAPGVVPVILNQPQRAIETTTVGYGTGTPSGASLKVVALNGVANLTIPANCKVFGTITVYPDADKHMKIRPGLGKVTVWKKDVGVNFPATVANLTFPIGGIGSSFFMVEITGANKEFNLASNVNTTFAVDILGYFG